MSCVGLGWGPDLVLGVLFDILMGRWGSGCECAWRRRSRGVDWVRLRPADFETRATTMYRVLIRGVAADVFLPSAVFI